jgi:outer membrane receptor protein involved in Fe transport
LPPEAPPGTPSSYDSDSLTSYEGGYKMNSSDGRFALDLSAFYLDWEDIQLFALVNGFGVNANGGSAVSKGFEFSTSFAPSEGLTFSFNGAYTDAKLTQDTDPIVGGQDGDALPYVPEWSFGLSTDYQWAAGDNSTAYVGGTLGYTGERPTGFVSTAEYYELDGFFNLGLRAGLEFNSWAFEVYVKNLTDTLGDASVSVDNTPFTGFVELGIIQPLTVGFTVGASF